MSEEKEKVIEPRTMSRKKRSVLSHVPPQISIKEDKEGEANHLPIQERRTVNPKIRVHEKVDDDEPLKEVKGDIYFVEETAAQKNARLRRHQNDDKEFEDDEEAGFSTEEETPRSSEEEDEDFRFKKAMSHRRRLDDLEKGGIDWYTTLLRLGVLFACIAAYGYYTYGAIFIIPPVTYKPLYPMMITNQAYNTTSRPLKKAELNTEVIKHKRGILYISSLLKTLKWHARQENYNVVCAHHLAHDMDIHPKVCILHNKFTDQMYSMVNPRVTGGSRETQRVAQTSVALGPIRMEFERMLAVQVSYISYPEKIHMYAQFTGPDAATLQLVIDEMGGDLIATNPKKNI